jgi:hypothetical protein
MSKTTIGFLVGAAFMFVGVMVALKASSLATHWEMIGPNAWGGTGDSGKEQAYRLLGVLAALFGFTIAALSFNRWLREPVRPVGDEYPDIRIKRRGFFD